MNTGPRRFILRLLVGVLTFAIGVGAAILFGGFTFSRNYMPTQYYRYKSCEHYRHSRTTVTEESIGPAPGSFLLKGPRGIRMRTELRSLPELPADAEAPAPSLNQR